MATAAAREVIAIVSEAIDAAALARHLDDPRCGGRVVFEGIVRDHHGGRGVCRLEYDAYLEMAVAQLEAIAREMAFRWPVGKMALVHRIGPLAIGEMAVFVGVATPHRAEAFEACRFGIDAIKRDVPIWKREFYADGTSAWQDNHC